MEEEVSFWLLDLAGMGLLKLLPSVPSEYWH